MRKLATIQTINKISPIENADAIEVAHVLSWEVVTKKNEHSVGDTVLFIEPDAWVPNHLAEFLSRGKEPREYMGVKGERLRTVRLRGQYSQGLIINIQDAQKYTDVILADLEEGTDVSEIFNINKYEAPLPAQLNGLVRGNFPAEGSKTSQNRIQSCFGQMSRDGLIEGNTYWAEEKIHGTSMSVMCIDGTVHVCSRNLSLKLDDDSEYVRYAHSCGIIDAIRKYCERTGHSIQISGELAGPGINGNQLNLDASRWFIFDVYDITERSMLSGERRDHVVDVLRELGATLINVPVVCEYTFSNETVSDILDMAEHKSLINPKTHREGLVFKHKTDGNISFKAISRKWLSMGYDE